MNLRILAGRYAKAFMENADSKHYSKLLEEQKKIKKLFAENSELLKYLSSDITKNEAKEEVFNQIAKNTDNPNLWNGLFTIITQKKRERYILYILFEIEKILFIKLDKLNMTLYLARDHKQKTIDIITKHFEKELSKKIIVDIVIQPELIGGFIAVVGGTLIDGSIKNKLENFKIS